MSLNWKITDQTMPTIIHVSGCTFGAVSTRILQEIYSQPRGVAFFFSMTKFNKKCTSPSAGKIFLYQLKELERFKSFFDITVYYKLSQQTANYVLKENKGVILYEVFKTIWTRVRTCQNGYATPLHSHIVVLMFRADFTIADAAQDEAEVSLIHGIHSSFTFASVFIW